MVSETKKETLPVKVLETKINKVIIDSNVKTLPLIYGKTNITYGNSNKMGGYGNTFYLSNI